MRAQGPCETKTNYKTSSDGNILTTDKTKENIHSKKKEREAAIKFNYKYRLIITSEEIAKWVFPKTENNEWRIFIL